MPAAPRHDHRPQRRRARRLRARRRRLRRPATWSRTRSGRGQRLAPLLGVDAGRRCCASSRAATPASSTSRRELPAAQADAVQQLKHRRASTLTPRATRDLPARLPRRRRCSASVGTDGKGLTGLEYSQDRVAARAPTASAALVSDALGQPIELARPQRRRARRRVSADARRRASRTRPSRCSPRSGATYRPKGATAIVMDPRDRRDPRAGQLAARRRQRPRRRARLRARRTAPSASTTSPARRSRRSRSPARCRTATGHARDAVRPAAADPGRRPHDRRAHERAATRR